jgi:hypothetical protein
MSKRPWLAGTIQKIQQKPPRCLFKVEEVLSGDARHLGNTFEIQDLMTIDANPSLGRPFDKSAWKKADDAAIFEGRRLIVCLTENSEAAEGWCPIRMLDRFHAVAEFKSLREKIASDKPGKEALAECKSKLLDELHRVAEMPFWGEFREGAVPHPRVDEMAEALKDLEAKTGEKIIDSILADSKEHIHLRAALIGFLEARDFDGGMRKYTDFSRVSTPLIAELRTGPKTAQDACALIVLMHAIYRNKNEPEVPLPHAGELIREALNPNNPSEYRLAFVKRFMHGWHEPHQTRRYDAVMTLLETEECNPDPKSAKYPPPDTVGDWLVFHMEMAQATHSIKTTGADGYDLARLHPSAGKRLGFTQGGGDPNRQLPPR